MNKQQESCAEPRYDRSESRLHDLVPPRKMARSAGSFGGTSNGTGGATIRRATIADAEACGHIIYDAFAGIAKAHNFPFDFPSRESACQIAASFIGIPAIFGIVAEIDGAVVGSNFLSESDTVRAVGPISVEPAQQGAGIGWQLMAAVLERAGPGAQVRLVQDAFNTASVSLYASIGFDVKEPLLLLQGTPTAARRRDIIVRHMTARDIDACNALCVSAHGFDRSNELRHAVAHLRPMVAQRGQLITGYMTAPTFWIMNHGVAETDQDMAALLVGAADASPEPVTLLLPTRQAELFRWCLNAGMRVVKPMTLMAKGHYQEPTGTWFPSVLY